MAIRGWLSRSLRQVETDPEIDKFRTLFRKEHLREKDFALLAGLSYQTVHKMFDGQTRRPQGLTYHKMAKAMGHEYVLTQTFKPDYDAEIPKARDEFKEYMADLKKKRERATKRKNGK